MKAYRPAACTACGASTGDGEGWAGLCGNCADKAEQAADRVARIAALQKEQAHVGDGLNPRYDEIQDELHDLLNPCE